MVLGVWCSGLHSGVAAFAGQERFQKLAIQFVKTLIADGHIDPGKMKDVFVHMVADDALMNRLTAATKAYAGPTLLAELKAAGQDAAEGFLSAHSDDLNKRGSVDLRAMFS